MLNRYAVIENKNPREIVLLRGTGCVWRRCTFCDYHLDCGTNEEENFLLNQKVLEQVTGRYQKLEVIDSGSYPELDQRTRDRIPEICRARGINTLYFECHYLYREQIPSLKQQFAAAGITAKAKLGVETFDRELRENVFLKGIPDSDPAVIAENFDQACLLFGIAGQTEASMRYDIETGLRYFERICINIMTPNSTPVHPDREVIALFHDTLYPSVADDLRVDILFNNTDFGVG